MALEDTGVTHSNGQTERIGGKQPRGALFMSFFPISWLWQALGLMLDLASKPLPYVRRDEMEVGI